MFLQGAIPKPGHYTQNKDRLELLSNKVFQYKIPWIYPNH